jgi:hypothetical protein
MESFLSPPTAIPFKPWSQPLITSPRPRTKENGAPAVLESNCFPLVNLPMYLDISMISETILEEVKGKSLNVPHRESLAWLGDGSSTGLDVLVFESGSKSPLNHVSVSFCGLTKSRQE